MILRKELKEMISIDMEQNENFVRSGMYLLVLSYR